MTLTFGARRSAYLEIETAASNERAPLSTEEQRHFESLDLLYRSLCALMYNYVSLSDHPGGSISAGRFMAALFFDRMDYDLSQSQRDEADLISFGAGRKAMGITGFTLPAMFRWNCSDVGRSRTLHPYREGHFLGSGQGYVVLAEAGLDGKSQYRAIKEYEAERHRNRSHADKCRSALCAAGRRCVPRGRERLSDHFAAGIQDCRSHPRRRLS